MARSLESKLELFWAKVDKQPGDGCWLWTGSISNRGYGFFQGLDGVAVAHRWIYQQEHGPLHQDTHLDHICRTRHCVRSSHLEPVTPRENVLRGIGISAENARKTHCPQGHPLSGANLYQVGNRRHCRTCRANNDKARKLAIHGGRPHPKDRTACIHGHTYTPENTKINYKGHRVCITCERAKTARLYAKKSKGLGLPSTRTHCPQGHPYDATNTYIGGKGERQCRTCRNERLRKARAEGRYKR